MADNPQLRRIALLVIGLIFVFAYFDQTPSFLNSRESVFISLWWVGFATLAVAYYTFRKDLSEALAIFAIGVIELTTGLEDYFFFLIYKLQGKAVEFCVNPNLNQWDLMNIADKYILGNSCTTFLGLFINSVIIGGFISYFTYKWLIKQRW